jgi:diadenosine tetraphosphate (Ap4A) HIT family hydrolase
LRIEAAPPLLPPPRVDNCLFCSGLGRIYARRGDVIARLDDYPIVRGHTLVCPDRHYPSFADVGHRTMANAQALIDDVSSAVEPDFGAFAVLEHGRTAHCIARNPAERFCHHAHLHLLPLDEEVLTSRLDAWVPRLAEGPLSTLLTQGGTEDGYLYVGSIQGGVVYRASRPLPAHILRTVAADALGAPESADWCRMAETRSGLELREDAWSALQQAGVADGLTVRGDAARAH